ncbi:MAG TPA: glycoside hydrolase, partial [Phycisphaerae bacterium]|nr:glycoside hydrolase [Phycisphaerae bacterium]
MKTRLAAAAYILLASAFARAADINLAGDWRILLDPQNNGDANGLQTPAHWAAQQTQAVKLPGSIQSQKIGDLPSAKSPWTARIGLAMLNNAKYLPYQKEGDFKTPFWLTPARVYVGSAWFQKEIEIPADWKDQRILFTLERPHWETTVFVDGKQAAPPQNSLGTAHVHDLTAALTPGKHTLIVRVDNRLKVPVGNDASAVTDQTQSNWNGIVGEIKLSTTKKIWIDDAQVFPDVAARKAKVRITIGNKTGAPGKGTVGLNILTHATTERPQQQDVGTAKSFPVTWDASGGKAEVEIPLTDDIKTWDEFSPKIYDLNVMIRPDGGADVETRTIINEGVVIPFGLREISTKGPQLLLNNKPIMLRGTLDCCIFPLTGYPPTGPEGAAYWKKIYTQLKAFGLNHIRFHSWCPPEIAFQVAAEMGVYLQIEGGVWAAFGSSGRPPSEVEPPDAGGRGGAPLDTWIVKEANAMLKAYGNHPSFIMMAAANEPGSRTNQPNAQFLGALVNQWKAADPRHLYTAGSNWPNIPEANYQVMSRPRMNGSNELTRPPQTTSDYSAIVREYPNQPVISHETGQWCVYPNFDEIKKYTGALHPGNLEIFKDFLDKAGMGDQAHDFLMASGKFQTLLYKEEIEALLRTPNIGGFQLLDLHDFPGQGTAPVGVL